MNRTVVITLCLLLSAVPALAADTRGKEEAKELSGMSIVGNDEAPKSLYIVPWKSSEIGVETTLNKMTDSGDAPVDRDVFARQLQFYEASTADESTGRN